MKCENTLKLSDCYNYVSQCLAKHLPKSEHYREELEQYDGQIVEFRCNEFDFEFDYHKSRSGFNRVCFKHFFIGNVYIQHMWIAVDKPIRNIIENLENGKYLSAKGIIGRYQSAGEQNIGIIYLISINKEEKNK